MAYMRERLPKGKSPAQDFTDEEKLYRAFPPDALEDGELEVDALELPDMSVNRGKYSQPSWLLLLDKFKGFGVATFRVKDIPTPLQHLGTWLFSFRPYHAPTPNNYPHSEVRAFNDKGNHIKASEHLDADLSLRWRNRLLQRVRVEIRPGQDGGSCD